MDREEKNNEIIKTPIHNGRMYLLRAFLGCLLIGAIFTFGSCSKYQTQGALQGAMIGGVLGNALSENKDKETGTLVGALIGSYVGSSIGVEEDRSKQSSVHEKKVHELKREIRYLEAEHEKWCDCCKKVIALHDARCCPYCGDDLISKKYCPECNVILKPSVLYRYCPYCRGAVRLRAR